MKNINCYKTNTHSKFLLQYHLILVCKYRRKIMSLKNISNSIKQYSIQIAEKQHVIIHFLEVDSDHIHYMLETTPNINLSNFIKIMKSYVTYHIWNDYSKELSKYYWKEHTLFSDGYFISSIGNVSHDILKQYIKNQGQ